MCHTNLPSSTRALDAIQRLTPSEKLLLLSNHASPAPSIHLPAYQWWNEALHGLAHSPGVSFDNGTSSLLVATSFPMPIATSHSFNKTLFRHIGDAISTEARAFFNDGYHSGLTFWAPNINIFRDPRWGRGQETPGEDPLLTSEYATHFIRGMQQGIEDHHSPPPSLLKTSACAKHFAAYSVEDKPYANRHSFDAKVTTEDLFETYLPPFHAAVTRGYASAVMCSYNAVNGIPSCANRHFLTDILRNTWKFEGYITSDCGAVDDVYSHHLYAENETMACSEVLRAGTDSDCGYFFQDHLEQAVSKEEGVVKWSDIDLALKHLLEVQIRLGLFDEPEENHPYSEIGMDQVDSVKHRTLALEAARSSVVLLKNENWTFPYMPKLLQQEQEHLKGISREEKEKREVVAIIGPHSTTTTSLLGNYYGNPPFIKSIRDGFVDLNLFDDVLVFQGCNIHNNTNDTEDEIQKNITKAIDVAHQADLVILAMGLDQSVECEGMDRSHLSLSGHQSRLIREVSQALANSQQQQKQTPVALVIFSGGSVDLSWERDSDFIHGIYYAGYPGPFGGVAIAEAVMGLYSPHGRLSQTFYPKSFEEECDMTDMKMTPDDGKCVGRGYRYYQGDAVFSFGHGLHYANVTERMRIGAKEDDFVVLVHFGKGLNNKNVMGDFRGDDGTPTIHYSAANGKEYDNMNTNSDDDEKIIQVNIAVSHQGKIEDELVMETPHTVLLYMEPIHDHQVSWKKKLVAWSNIHLLVGQTKIVTLKIERHVLLSVLRGIMTFSGGDDLSNGFSSKFRLVTADGDTVFGTVSFVDFDFID